MTTKKTFFFTVHVPRDHMSVLARSGVTRVQVESWEKTNISKLHLKFLLSTVSRSTPSRSLLGNFYYPGKDLEVEYVDRSSLSYYFRCLTVWSIESIRKKQQAKNRRVYLVLNFMPFEFRSSSPDRIFAGIEDGFSNVAEMKEIGIIVLTRNSNAFQRSQRYASLVEEASPKLDVTLVDYDGFFRRGLDLEKIPIPRKMFREIICGEEEDVFYKKLIFGTNSHIGHFVLNNSHVRTHYDLEDFLRKDSVKERIFATIFDELKSRFGDLENILIVYAGLEKAALMRFSQFIRDYCEAERVPIDAELIDVFAEEVRTAESVLLLTDILNTTKSLKTAYDWVLSLRKGELAKNVFPFSIVRMSNTPRPSKELDYGCALEIRREYYSAEGGCRLCDLNQPPTPVDTLSDFKRVHPEQMTPYDFWEIVSDSEALRINEEDPRGRILDYRVDTLRIINRYGRWLQNLISAKYSDHFSDQLPSVILTVDENTGKRFARLVAYALKLEDSVIRSVSRKRLRPYLTSSYANADDRNAYRGEKVLIVDDGMNSGDTVRRLESLLSECRPRSWPSWCLIIECPGRT